MKLNDKPVTQLLDECKTDGERGLIFEALWNIVAKFNFIPGIVIDKHINSNVNKKPVRYLGDFDRDFLKKNINAGSSSGNSDITFTTRTDKYGSTCKYFADQTSKSLEEYDLDKLNTALPTFKKIVFTNDSAVFSNTYNRSLNKRLHDIAHVFDLKDLIKAIENVKYVMQIHHWDFTTVLTKRFGNITKVMKMKFHQDACLAKTACMNKSLPILWGLKCRSGKSFIMAALIYRNNFQNSLIVTPIPNESISALVEMFENHVEFDDYVVIHYKRGSKIPDTPKKKIIIASKQFLQNKIIPELEAITFDVTFWDENHHGGHTEISHEICKKYVKNGLLVALTATYEKTKESWKIPDSQCFFWDLEDEKFCKNGDINKLIEKYGDCMRISQDHDIVAEYAEMPQLKILTATHSAKFIADFKQFNEDDSYSFNMEALLSVKDGEFVNNDKVRHLLDYYFGNNFNNGKNITDRIQNNYDTRKPFTQLWFLPYDTNLTGISNCLKNLISTHVRGKKYRVEILNSKQDESEGKLLEYITSVENEATESGCDGVILLLGFKCSMGISLPRVDIVVLLNNVESLDQIRQMMMRCMTEDRGKNKKFGFVVDFNQKRVLRSTMDSLRHFGSVRSNIERVLNVIDVDADMMVTNNRDDLVEQMYIIWKNSKVNHLEFVQCRLARISSANMSSDDRKKIAYFMKIVSSTKKQREEIEVNDEDNKIPDGVSIISEKSEVSVKTEKKEEVVIDYGKELVTSIPYLVGILTHKNNDTDIIRLLISIKNDEVLCSIFLEQCKTWWGIVNSAGFIDILVELIMKYYLPVVRDINVAIEILKERMTCLLDSKKELLDMINSALAPKAIEKKTFGEVFTPLSLVEDMLSKLPSDVWSNENLKWFDPAVGMGNFMVCVYYRLMDGLKCKIPDETERKIHIIGNMLYMSELNSKNVFLCKTIFGEKSNVHCGNTLSMNILECWGIEKFDIIVGNPPYQDDSGNRGKGHTLWDVFVKKALCLLEEGGLLVYVHPAGWRQPNHEMLNIMKNKQIIYLSIHDEKDGVKTFRCNTRYDWYVLENKNCYKETKIHAQDGSHSMINLSKLDLIPNFMFDDIVRYTTGHDKLTIINSESAYECRKKWISKTKTEEFKYPVIYSINRQNIPTLRYSSRNDNGHFGIAKVIFASGATGFIADSNGEYGLTQWAKSIASEPSKHQKILDTLNSAKFKQVVLACSIGKAEINTKVLKMFRSDFFDMF
jgi:superfamily II DNA or RNA helicase